MGFLEACTEADRGRRVGLRDDSGKLIELRLRGIRKVASLVGFWDDVTDGVGFDEIMSRSYEYLPDSFMED